MLYLVMPSRHLKWTANIGQNVLDLAEVKGKDIGLLDWWAEADTAAEDAVVRVALRYGIASSLGIVVDAGHVALVRRPNQMRATFREADVTRAEVAPQIAPIDQFVEKNLAPGWIQAGVELDARVKESMDRSLAEADEAAEREFARQEPKTELMAHWTELGGSLPHPV